MGKPPRPTREEVEELKAQVADLEERIRRLEGAARAFAVVYAIPRMPTPGDGDEIEHP